MYLRTTSAALALWLEHAGGTWHVEGETVLASSLPLPSPALALSLALRKRGGDLTVLAPASAESSSDVATTLRELSGAAHVVDEQRVFQLAWVREDGSVQDSWLLAEQPPHSPEIDDDAAARGVVAAFRAGRVTVGRT